MIRPDPERPGVFLVDVSSELVTALSYDWGPPVQMKIEDGELVMRLVEEKA